MRLLGAALLVVVSLSPLLPLLTRHWPVAAPLARAFEPWFAIHCERDPARTPSLAGVPLTVCVRCSGIYFGLGLGALLRRPLLAPLARWRWVLIAAAAMLLDVVLEEHGLHGPWPMVRLLSGLALAYPVGLGLGAALTRAPAVDHSP